jgi:hypothetical protein
MAKNAKGILCFFILQGRGYEDFNGFIQELSLPFTILSSGNSVIEA